MAGGENLDLYAGGDELPIKKSSSANTCADGQYYQYLLYLEAMPSREQRRHAVR